jgi:AcrR family transcriptional regulator
MKAAARPYHQRARAAGAEANTERILRAAHELFLERPFDQVTLAAVAERAGVGLQTLIRRVGTKDGLARAVNAWHGPQLHADRGAPDSDDPARVAAAIAGFYERWGESIDRTLRQQDASPALVEAAATGRRAHREWIAAAFAEHLARRDETARHRLLGRLVGVCGVELWLVLRRDAQLSPADAQDAVRDLIAASLATP